MMQSVDVWGVLMRIGVHMCDKTRSRLRGGLRAVDCSNLLYGIVIIITFFKIPYRFISFCKCKGALRPARPTSSPCY